MWPWHSLQCIPMCGRRTHANPMDADRNGGREAGLGGAIFNDSATLAIRNNTFTGSFATRGLGGNAGVRNGAPV